MCQAAAQAASWAAEVRGGKMYMHFHPREGLALDRRNVYQAFRETDDPVLAEGRHAGLSNLLTVASICCEDFTSQCASSRGGRRS